MPWWKQGTGYSEKGRKDRRLSMSERMCELCLWPGLQGVPQWASLLAPGCAAHSGRVSRPQAMGSRLPAVRPCCLAHGNGRLGYVPTPRRTVYMHDDWVWHRSSDRFVRNMLTIGSSGINQALSKELSFVTLDAVSDRHPMLTWEPPSRSHRSCRSVDSIG